MAGSFRTSRAAPIMQVSPLVPAPTSTTPAYRLQAEREISSMSEFPGEQEIDRA